MPPLDSLFLLTSPQNNLHSPHLIVTDFIHTDLSSPTWITGCVPQVISSIVLRVSVGLCTDKDLLQADVGTAKPLLLFLSHQSRFLEQQITSLGLNIAKPGLQFAHRLCQLGFRDPSLRHR